MEEVFSLDQIDLTEEQFDLLNKHLNEVIEKNKITNLTRILNYEEGRLLHIEDSLSAYTELLSAPEGRYGDLGTGGGFPGIPLAILSGKQTLLIDSVKKKVAIVDEIVKKLSLVEQIGTSSDRIEELAQNNPESFSVLTARALSSLSSLMELASPLLIEHGILICYKSRIGDEEYANAIKMQKKLAMKLVSDRSFLLSDKETQRRVIVFKKQGVATIKLPRRVGMAQKNPL